MIAGGRHVVSEGWVGVLLLVRVGADRLERTEHELCLQVKGGICMRLMFVPGTMVMVSLLTHYQRVRAWLYE